MNNRSLKDLLYEQVARVGKAVSSPKRLELLELLAQGEKTVEVLAGELSSDIKLTSAHLKALKEARLVTSRRDGKYMAYRLTGNDVATLWVVLRQVAEEHLLELRMALEQMVADPTKLSSVSRETLLAQARNGEVIVIDVRPADEFAVAHLPFARSMPMAELEKRLAELPRDKEIVAYCRGPFCLMSDEALTLLASHGYRVRKIRDGVSEWQAAGLAVEIEEKR
ncbi:ArsR family transcriptional regulator [Rugosibacter aromaticivorans]|uniref:ArsR family transcriptional regulator n=1 Tax=Rugosibacter aromaticivorans TaxID=1565605 RepID=A0A0C5JA03_9PROT|nr:metalloregulator ArsR/SmtB family transcription factor [Rugosibacter aromaticivorans]AJP48519.1 ArsR family transcriptional regulator [Rugosibacter aromaticivorans]TBR13243.1 MAG: metalloregulator ArsR/SmtB family transcription factor [Rugosibacter sp.]